MKAYDVDTIRKNFRGLSKRANEPLGAYNDNTLALGRYVPGKSPWERHTNGDELLFVTDGYVDIELLEADGSSTQLRIDEGALFVVPKGKWHQLTATDSVNILYASPSEDGAERTREHPMVAREAKS